MGIDLVLHYVPAVQQTQGMNDSSAAGEDNWAVPGDRLGRLAERQAGPGTYGLGRHIFASIVGKIETLPAINDLPYVTVTSQQVGKKAQGQDIVIEVGHVITGTVVKITSKQANIEIRQVGEAALRHNCQGIIKKEDIRRFEVDRVEVYKCFRPADTVRAKVISLGDSRQYYLSTSDDDLGVCSAANAATGNLMEPLNWHEFCDPVSGQVEERKVAKPPDTDANMTSEASL